MKTDKRSSTAPAIAVGWSTPRNTNFRIKKRQVAAYFNNGTSSQTVWAETFELGLKDETLVAAVNAARDAFNAIWLAKPAAPEVG